ncbi:DUF7310 family coiled-coil domain-containing protein [Salinigranum sp. GCM10025319]|uniref:DUF7310 family coiled-coil domain-containing protein n=1 Tax=Salinigranum sp. GCM10025319 TaxID=3252687 RepID=UPI00360E45A2
MTDDLIRRLEAVERAVTDGHTDLAGVANAADTAERLATVERRLDDVEARLDDLDATTQAVRGYLGGVDGVTEDVERRADLALAKAESVEAAVFDGDDGLAVERLSTGDGTTVGVETETRTRGTGTDTAGSTELTGSSGRADPTESRRDSANSARPIDTADTTATTDATTSFPFEAGTTTSEDGDDSLVTRLRDLL